MLKYCLVWTAGRNKIVGDYFKALRWKAAITLTSNFSNKERDLLFDKLSDNPANAAKNRKDVSKYPMDGGEDKHFAYEPSIDEAIAATKL